MSPKTLPPRPQLIGQLLEAPDALETFPRMGRSVPEDDSRTSRELIVGSYHTMYEVGAERVEILAVVHGSRYLSPDFPPWERLR